VGLDRAGSTLLARAAHVLIAHDRGTADRAAEELGISKDRIDVIPHGSYIGVYASGRSPRAVRDELGIDPDSFVFLCFGHLRAYKAIEVLLSSLDSLPGDIALIIAGVPLDEQTERSVLAVAARDERIKPILEFVPDERVAELFGASDAAVLPRGDGGTSGSLVLALSMGLAVVAAARPDYEELVGDAGWLFEAGNASSLAAALEQAASDRDDAARRGRLAHARAAELGWPEIAGRTASILRARRARKARRFA
jgi:glycosyltransferase involved in cell wall biosynthesis